MGREASRIPRSYAPPQNWGAEHIALPPGETRHLRAVLRAGPGAIVRVFDGQGREAEARLLDNAGSGAARLEIVRCLPVRPRGRPIELAQAIPKRGRMEMVLQKATELGAAAIQPLLTEHAVVRLDGSKRAKKLERWQKILVVAAKQCNLAALPELKPVCTLDEYLQQQEAGGTLLLCSLDQEARPLKEVLGQLDLGEQAPVRVLVGPEGDFSAEEHSAAVSAGAVPVSLGDRILRTDTAAFYALAALDYALS